MLKAKLNLFVDPVMTGRYPCDFTKTLFSGEILRKKSGNYFRLSFKFSFFYFYKNKRNISKAVN